MAGKRALRAVRAAAQRSASSKATLCTNGPVEVASKGFVLGGSRPSLTGQPRNWSQVPSSFVQGLGDFAAPPSALVVSHSHMNVDSCMPGMPWNEGSMAPVSSLMVRHSYEEQDVLGLESLLRMPCIAGESGYAAPPTAVVVGELGSVLGRPVPVDYWHEYESSMSIYR